MPSYSAAKAGGNSQSRGQTFESFLEPAPKRRNFFLRLLCGSGNSYHEDRHVVAPRDVPQTRSAQQSQPSVRARREARHTGDTQGLYRTRTGYNADTGSVYYSPRNGLFGLSEIIAGELPMLRNHYNATAWIAAFHARVFRIFDAVQRAQRRHFSMTRWMLTLAGA